MIASYVVFCLVGSIMSATPFDRICQLQGEAIRWHCWGRRRKRPSVRTFAKELVRWSAGSIKPTTPQCRATKVDDQMTKCCDATFAMNKNSICFCIAIYFQLFVKRLFAAIVRLKRIHCPNYTNTHGKDRVFRSVFFPFTLQNARVSLIDVGFGMIVMSPDWGRNRLYEMFILLLLVLIVIQYGWTFIWQQRQQQRQPDQRTRTMQVKWDAEQNKSNGEKPLSSAASWKCAPQSSIINNNHCAL